jgi:Flp pilus assembly protein TadD
MNLQLLYNQATKFQQLGDFGRAEGLYRQIIAAELKRSFAPRYILGMMLAQQGRYAEALDLIGAALEINPNAAEALTNYGNILKILGRFEEALASYNRALAIKPGDPVMLYNRGMALWDLKRFEEALESYDQALTFKPDYADALNNRGFVLRELNRLDEALASVVKALAIKPDDVAAISNLGAILCENNRVEEGLAAFTRHAELVYGRSKISSRNSEPRAPHKVRHDQEQYAYLTSGNVPSDDSIVESMFHFDSGNKLDVPAVNPNNAVGDIVERWRTGNPQIIVVDNFLTDQALENLRRFCWGSTMWRKVYSDGYLGAMPEHGFSCPLLAQIADELRSNFPSIFQTHPLSYLWAFKYDTDLKGTHVHADFAAVNVNFWITSDDANLDPEGGGLIVWDVAAPRDWDISKYNGDALSIREFLLRSGARSINIPYRANRAVIFDSDLFHETAEMTFKRGYLNRRINVTLLYGRRL